MRHHVSQQLMRWFNVLFVEYFPVGEAGDSEWSKVHDRLMIYKPVLPNSPPGRLYVNEPVTHSLVNRRYANNIVHVITSLSPKKVLLFNFVYHFPEIMQKKIFCYKAYVCFDEFPKMQRRSFKRNALKAKYQEILFQHYENKVARIATHCFTPHYPLRNKLLRVNKNVEMLFHAHNWKLGSKVACQDGDGRIKVAFAGFIHYRLIDCWLERVLKENDIELYLIGPLNPAYDVNKLTKHQNIRLISALSESELLKTLTEMDVLIIPYHTHLPETEVLTTVSKLYQYILSEKPVVISNMPNFIRQPKGILYRADSANDFIAKIRQAHAEDCDELRALRAKIAAENTWDKRGEQLYDLLKGALGDILPKLEPE